MLVDTASKFIKQNKKVLDFGCGIGVVGITIFKKNKIKGILYASDISKNSINLAKLNAAKHKISIVANAGNLFEPWKGEKFDIILNDISGISQKIAKFSPWFKNISCETGEDGTRLTIKIITEAKKYLNTNGAIIFPVLSLSDKKKLLSLQN